MRQNYIVFERKDLAKDADVGQEAKDKVGIDRLVDRGPNVS